MKLLYKWVNFRQKIQKHLSCLCNNILVISKNYPDIHTKGLHITTWALALHVQILGSDPACIFWSKNAYSLTAWWVVAGCYWVVHQKSPCDCLHGSRLHESIVVVCKTPTPKTENFRLQCKTCDLLSKVMFQKAQLLLWRPTVTVSSLCCTLHSSCWDSKTVSSIQTTGDFGASNQNN